MWHKLPYVSSVSSIPMCVCVCMHVWIVHLFRNQLSTTNTRMYRDESVSLFAAQRTCSSTYIKSSNRQHHQHHHHHHHVQCIQFERISLFFELIIRFWISYIAEQSYSSISIAFPLFASSKPKRKKSQKTSVRFFVFLIIPFFRMHTHTHTNSLHTHNTHYQFVLTTIHPSIYPSMYLHTQWK